MIIDGLRWDAVLRAIDLPLSFWCIVRIFYVGVSFNQMLLCSTGSGLYVQMTYKEGLELRGVINGVILERVASILALVFLVGATMPLLLLPRLNHASLDRVYLRR